MVNGAFIVPLTIQHTIHNTITLLTIFAFLTYHNYTHIHSRLAVFPYSFSHCILLFSLFLFLQLLTLHMPSPIALFSLTTSFFFLLLSSPLLSFSPPSFFNFFYFLPSFFFFFSPSSTFSICHPLLFSLLFFSLSLFSPCPPFVFLFASSTSSFTFFHYSSFLSPSSTFPSPLFSHPSFSPAGSPLSRLSPPSTSTLLTFIPFLVFSILHLFLSLFFCLHPASSLLSTSRWDLVCGLESAPRLIFTSASPSDATCRTTQAPYLYFILFTQYTLQ